jgi:cytochrome bd-type quinol oxidase subunit 1
MDIEQNTRREPISLASERVFKFWDYPAFILISIFGIAAILYFYSHWFLFHDDWANHRFFYAIFGLSICASLLNNQGRWFLLPMMRRPYPVAAKAGWKVGVATTVVRDAEPLELLEESLRVLVALDYLMTPGCWMKVMMTRFEPYARDSERSISAGRSISSIKATAEPFNPAPNTGTTMLGCTKSVFNVMTLSRSSIRTM